MSLSFISSDSKVLSFDDEQVGTCVPVTSLVHNVGSLSQDDVPSTATMWQKNTTTITEAKQPHQLILLFSIEPLGCVQDLWLSLQCQEEMSMLLHWHFSSTDKETRSAQIPLSYQGAGEHGAPVGILKGHLLGRSYPLDLESVGSAALSKILQSFSGKTGTKIMCARQNEDKRS